MAARTYEELLAAQTELAHFNSHHDPTNGQFTSGSGSGSSSSRKAQRADKKFAKQEAKLTLYRESAKEAYNRTANALTYMTSDNKKERKEAGKYAAWMFELGETYKKKAEKQLEKINKDGDRILMSSLDPYSQAVGDAFVKRSVAGQVGWFFNPFESAQSSSKYKIDKEKATQLGKELSGK